MIIFILYIINTGDPPTLTMQRRPPNMMAQRRSQPVISLKIEVKDGLYLILWSVIYWLSLIKGISGIDLVIMRSRSMYFVLKLEFLSFNVIWVLVKERVLFFKCANNTYQTNSRPPMNRAFHNLLRRIWTLLDRWGFLGSVLGTSWG
jgi:hypothetical protein